MTAANEMPPPVGPTARLLRLARETMPDVGPLPESPTTEELAANNAELRNALAEVSSVVSRALPEIEQLFREANAQHAEIDRRMSQLENVMTETLAAVRGLVAMVAEMKTTTP